MQTEENHSTILLIFRIVRLEFWRPREAFLKPSIDSPRFEVKSRLYMFFTGSKKDGGMKLIEQATIFKCKSLREGRLVKKSSGKLDWNEQKLPTPDIKLMYERFDRDEKPGPSERGYPSNHRYSNVGT
ncbi:hypothetical protein RRG08_031123 [Elysia crispata]|uniref:Uncharacterized protein n=1 Tax=Elysia crispata TaxID=231223 RepID=A0AAE1DF72_9GAST|nr:hypothetical protein RRG08_031123 [Elysia crispata]